MVYPSFLALVRIFLISFWAYALTHLQIPTSVGGSCGAAIIEVFFQKERIWRGVRA